MRILHVIQFFTPTLGGSVTAACSLAMKQSQMKHEVTIATTDFGFSPEYASYASSKGVNIVRFPCRLNIGDFLISPAMNAWLHENSQEFDIAHMHNFRTYQNVITHHWAHNMRVPYVLQPDNSVPRVISRKGAKWLYDIAWGNKILDDASCIIAISEMETRFLKNLGIESDRTATIYTGIDTEPFDQLPAKGEFRAKLGLDNGKKLITYLGRIHQTKGLDSLLYAFSRVRHKYPTKLLIIGRDDGFKEHLTRIAESLDLTQDTLFVGAVDEREKIAAYVDTDVFVHPVRYMGGVGISPLEALMCGTPVIVTRECGEIVEKSDSGCVLDSHNDIDGLAAAIEHALDSPDEARKRAMKGREYIRERMSWGEVAREVEAVYEDCIRDFQ